MSLFSTAHFVDIVDFLFWFFLFFTLGLGFCETHCASATFSRIYRVVCGVVVFVFVVLVVFCCLSIFYCFCSFVFSCLFEHFVFHRLMSFLFFLLSLFFVFKVLQ